MLLRPTLIAVSALAAISVSAWAGEGAGEPFPPPNNAVVETPGITKPTMGAAAPFNYFYTPRPTVLNNYHQAPGSSADPFPFAAAGHVIQTGPAPQPAPSAVVTAPRSSTHG